MASPLPSILAEWRELTRQFNALAEDDPERIALSNWIDEVRSRYQAAARQVSDPVRESVIPRS